MNLVLPGVGEAFMMKLSRDLIFRKKVAHPFLVGLYPCCVFYRSTGVDVVFDQMHQQVLLQGVLLVRSVRYQYFFSLHRRQYHGICCFFFQQVL